MTYYSPYLVTVTSTAGGMAACSYVDARGQKLPPDAVLTTQTRPGAPGRLAFDFVETRVDGQRLRLLGAAVKTVGNDPTMQPYDYLYATRDRGGKGHIDHLSVPWSPDTYTRRGVVLLFGSVDDKGNMIAFIPSSDPQTQNDPL